MTTAIRNSDFINSLGVNVHVEYTDGKYANAAEVISDLSYLGINHVRDATLNPTNEGQASYDLLASAGVKFDMLFLGAPIASSVSLLDAFVAAHPGSISAIEGLNEINNWPVTFGDLTGNAAALAYQSSLYSTIKADHALSGAPVYDLTNDTNIGGVSDYSNVHAYPWSGQQPYQTLLGALQATALPGEGAVLTEAGYYTMTNGVGWGGVDQATQAKLTLNLLMDATKVGFQQTYLYQLLDAYADPTGSDPDTHFGLFDINNAPKPVANALHNLTSILQDSAGGAATFQVGSLSYQVTGMPATGSSLLLEKANGAYDIVLWNEPAIWDATTNTKVDAADVSVTVNLGGVFATTQVFDPLSASGVAPISSVQNASQVQVQLSDHPIVIEVSPAAPPVAAVNPHLFQASAAGGLLTGGTGDNTYIGGSGNDTIVGGTGNDTLIAGTGYDVLTGGLGNDTFVFSSLSNFGGANGGDMITDFSRGHDHIDLKALDARLPAGSSLNFIGKSAFSHHAGEVHFAKEAGGIALSVDINGDGVADAVLHLHGLSNFSSSDLFL